MSFGNGTVLDASEYLEYFGQDKGIEVIGMYLEGVRDGKKFLSVLREVSAKKPVVIWKGGRTGEAVRAIASHTSSLAIQQEIWNAVLRQGRAISVSNLQELIDTVKALVYLPPVRDRGVGITGGSGGESVAIADAFTEEGLEVPSLTPESYKELQSFFNLIGASYRNPIDTGRANSREGKRILEILEQDTNIGNLALLVPAKPGWRWDTLQELDEDIRCIIDVRRRMPKPIIVVTPFSTPEEMKQARDIATRLREGGVPVFHTYEGAARALANAFRYYHASH